MRNEKNSFVVTGLAAALNDEDRAGLNALKDQLQYLAGEHPETLESLSPAVKKRVEVLREIQRKHDDLEAKFLEERAALEAKYQKMYQPLYAKRYDIVNGVVEVDGATKEAAVDQDSGEDAEERGVPNFWLIAMRKNEVLAEEIRERDLGALKYLKDIKWCRMEDPKGFKLEFFFDTNPYFKNTILTKTYHMVDEDEPILEKATGTEIEWYPGKCLTQKLLRKKLKKGSKDAKSITKTEDCESFFNFFDPPEVPGDDEIIDEDSVEELQDLMEQDYDVGTTIREKIIPHAVSWFTGEATPGGIDSEDSDDDYDSDIDRLNDDDDDDDIVIDEKEDENESNEGNTTKKGGSTQAGEGQQGGRPADCKQQ